MTIQLTSQAMRQIFPRAPQAVLDAFVAKQAVLDAAGITHTRPRLAYFFANIEHESGGFTITNLTENIRYSAERMAQVWPNRFPSADAVRAKYGTADGWQLKAFDDIYGGRMGNRPGTHDGSAYIGRGGPQWTGRGGYAECEKRSGLPAVTFPSSVSTLDKQPEVCAAFWSWKGLNSYADTGNFRGAVKVWNGGSNGLADRQHLMAGNDPVIQRLATVNTVMPVAKLLAGGPPTPAPPKEVLAEATKNQRKARTAAGAAGAAGAANEGAKTTGTVAPDKAPISSTVSYTLIGAALVAIFVITFLIARTSASVIKNWF